MKKIVAMALAAVLASPLFAAKVKFAYGTLTVAKADDASLEQACLEYPDAKQISVSGTAVTSVKPLTGMKKLERVSIAGQRGTRIGDIALLSSIPSIKSLSVEDAVITDTDLSFLEGMPQLKSLLLRKASSGALSLKGLASLKNLDSLSLRGFEIPDLAEIGELSSLRNLSLAYTVLGDLAPLARLENVRKLDFYGAELKDFAPLSKMANLEEINYYSAILPKEKWQSLGSLGQVKRFYGGLTKMDSIEWVRDAASLEELKLFCEDIRDYTPLAGAKNLKYLRAWKMECPVDISPLKDCPKLERLELPDSDVASIETVSLLASLKKLDVQALRNDPLDLGFLKGHPSLTELAVSRNKNVTGLEALETVPTLAYLRVGRGQFPDEALDALGAKIKELNPAFRITGR